MPTHKVKNCYDCVFCIEEYNGGGDKLICVLNRLIDIRDSNNYPKDCPLLAGPVIVMLEWQASTDWDLGDSFIHKAVEIIKK